MARLAAARPAAQSAAHLAVRRALALLLCALSSTGGRSEYVTSVRMGRSDAVFSGFSEKSYITDGQCSGYLEMPRCPWNRSPAAVKVTVRDDAAYPTVHVNASLESATIFRSDSADCGGKAVVDTEVVCAVPIWPLGKQGSRSGAAGAGAHATGQRQLPISMAA